MPNYCYKTPREAGQRAKELRKQAPLPERLLWNALRELKLETGLKFCRQHPLPPYFADFACVKAHLLIELDGTSHDARQVYDAHRETELRKRGWTIIRFSNEDVLNNLDGVVSTILKKARELLCGNLPAHP